MLKFEPPEEGTFVIIALILLSLLFAGLWIVFAVGPNHNPQVLFPWFGAGVVAIIVVGLLSYLRR